MPPALSETRSDLEMQAPVRSSSLRDKGEGSSTHHHDQLGQSTPTAPDIPSAPATFTKAPPPAPVSAIDDTNPEELSQQGEMADSTPPSGSDPDRNNENAVNPDASVAVHLASDDDAPITIAFVDVSYTVQVPVRKLTFKEKIKGITCRGLPKPEMQDKVLLKNVSGVIRPGTLTALMGPSGAGKSTLLDVLAGRKTSGVIQGDLLYNNKPMTKELHRIIGYVEQTDTLLGALTVRELLMYTARLRLPSSTTHEQRTDRVDYVINVLGLQRCADSVIGSATIRGISGGQAKRVNIGIELITDCRVLFLDEPTTGLDSATSYEVMSAVRKIADRGRSIICTIHQPSEDVFNLFDRLLLLVKGEVVYLGSIPNTVPYFEKLGFKFVPGSNPADYIIAVTGPGTGQHARTVEGPEVSAGFFADEYRRSNLAEQRLISARQTAAASAVDASQKEHEPVRFVNSAWHNFVVLLERFWWEKCRDKYYLSARFLRIVFLNIVLGTLFSNQPHTSAGVYNMVSILQFSVQVFAFGALAFIGFSLMSRPFFLRERHAATYQVSSWYWANVISDMPFNLLQVLLWSVVLYWSTGLKSTAGAFFTFVLFLLVLTDAALAMSQAIAAGSADFESANIAIFPIILLSFLFSGFYVQKPLIPDYFIWAYVISFLNYALNGLAINNFQGQNDYTQTSDCYACFVPTTPCQDIVVNLNGTTVCCVSSTTVSYPFPPDDILSAWGFGPESLNDNLWINFLALSVFWIFWRILAYLVMRFKIYDKR
ncbi:ATP-binding cassette transporter sub-family G member 2c [Capsaspora owczarzaki ATCC 30864]|uniref:ATP-binding cassette transporter sub-family G member 2c n=1 Tax=Capsaspora owczarzaki (strain ATCC 30864) TaxID=595528 RepID=A0A0D2X4M0_CAPO3|nr:ATP-binding cassette transporter sub-family G member 2c [Capsaspora owczarzaki ATCC 30864]KJE96294.1 ATP-binding cassette transporter sub-family G member 2c [Capsaspora owczarzaki ATCC 30864]|eukprot:XP_004344258.2 ATP-binding cassette transporter sub-family G member 2c [Capsaspora owczarzaki ATCC 30864]